MHQSRVPQEAEARMNLSRTDVVVAREPDVQEVEKLLFAGRQRHTVEDLEQVSKVVAAVNRQAEQTTA